MHFGVDKVTIVSTPLGPVSMSNPKGLLMSGLICHVHNLEPNRYTSVSGWGQGCQRVRLSESHIRPSVSVEQASRLSD